MASADIINGMASPDKNKLTRSNIPSYRDVVTAATVRIVASIGPMHGVHPAPNPMPINREPT